MRLMVRGQSASRSFSTKAQAQRWAEQKQRELEGGIVHDGSGVLFADLLADYSKRVSRRKKSAVTESYYRKTWAALLGSRPVGAITPADVLQACERRPVKPQTVLRELRYVSDVFRFAADVRGLAVVNPVPVARTQLRKSADYRRSDARDRRLKPGEWERITSELPYQMAVIARFLLATGRRLGEVLKLEWSDIDGKRMLLRGTKTDDDQLAPLSAEARAILDEWRAHSPGPAVFAVQRHSVSQAWRRACMRAGVVDLRLHDLRHECASRLADAGYSILEIQAVTGHRDLRSLRRYTHVDVEKLADKL